jgi:hypothetical protein
LKKELKEELKGETMGKLKRIEEEVVEKKLKDTTKSNQ